MTKIKYTFRSSIWKDPNASWYFVSLPLELSKEIRAHHQWEEEGWGRLKVSARIEDVEWDTAIWFDTKMDRYLIPIKAEIRRKLEIEVNQNLDLMVQI